MPDSHPAAFSEVRSGRIWRLTRERESLRGWFRGPRTIGRAQSRWRCSFVLAWFSGRWPRIAGVLLLTVAVGFFLLIELPHIARTSILEVITDVTFILFIGPLLASGVALLGAGKSERPEDAEVSEAEAPHG